MEEILERTTDLKREFCLILSLVAIPFFPLDEAAAWVADLSNSQE